MKVEVAAPEAIEIFNEIQKRQEAFFEMIRLDLQKTVGECLTGILAIKSVHDEYKEAAFAAEWRQVQEPYLLALENQLGIVTKRT